MADNPEPLLPQRSPVYGYVRSSAAKPRSVYRLTCAFGTRTGKALGICIAFKNTKMTAFRQSRVYHHAKAAKIIDAANYMRRFNPIVPYGRFLKSLSPKTSAYLLAYDNVIGLRPLYLLYMAYATHKGMGYFSELGTTKAFAASLALATVEVKIIASAAQIIRVPMRTFHAACMLPKVLTVNPDEIERTTYSGRVFGWTVDKAHSLVGRRITSTLNYRNRMSITVTAGYRATRKALRATIKPSL